jgi:hypothetical protein
MPAIDTVGVGEHTVQFYDLRDDIDKKYQRFDALLRLHTQLFPQYHQYQDYMRKNIDVPANTDPRFVEHWQLVEVDGQPVGMHFFKYAPDRRCGLGLGIAIAPQFRAISGGPYKRLMQYVIEMGKQKLVEDAQRLKRPQPVGQVAEVEYELLAHLERNYRDYGFQLLPVEYHEPSQVQGMSDEVTTFTRAHLGLFPIERGYQPDRAVLRNIVYAILVDHYGLPENHWVVQRALKNDE